MQHIDLTSKFVLAALIATVVFSAITVPSAVAQSTTSPPIRANSVTSGSIKDGEVKTADIANDAVTSGKIKNGEVKAEDIADGVIPDSGGGQPTVNIVTGEGVLMLPGSGGTDSATCPDGEILTGGGFSASSFASEVNISRPSGTDTWFVGATNHATFTAQLQAYAICLDFTP
jgi:hypothetical protein